MNMLQVKTFLKRRAQLWLIYPVLFVIVDISVATADIRSASVAEVAGMESVESESVVSLSRRGMHLEALSNFLESGEQPPGLAERNAAARSAWALGLVDDARTIWDGLFADKRFAGQERSRAMLARAILELQESEYQRARAFAERAAQHLQASNLRAQLWLVVAESLKEQGILSSAENYYQRAVSESSGDVQAEARLLLGECQVTLGMLDKARAALTSVPVSSRFTPKALRQLVELDLDEGDYDGVLTWIDEGLENYPDQFQDPKMNYAHVMALIGVKNLEKARTRLTEFNARHSDANPWFVMAEAALEGELIRQNYKGGKLNNGSTVLGVNAR